MEKLPVASFLRRAVKSGTEGKAFGRRAISMRGEQMGIMIILSLLGRSKPLPYKVAIKFCEAKQTVDSFRPCHIEAYPFG